MNCFSFRLFSSIPLSLPFLLGIASCSPAPNSPEQGEEISNDEGKAATATSENTLQGQFVKARPLENVASLAAPATSVAAPNARYWVTPPFTGRVHSIHVQAGDLVEEGQKLASLILPSLAQHAAHYLTANEKVTTLRTQSERFEKLHEAGMARAADRAAANVALAEAMGEYRAAKAAFASAGLSVSAASSLLEHGGFYTIRAAQAGVIANIFSYPGAPASSEAPLIEIASKAEVRIQASLPPGLLHGKFSGFSFVVQGARGVRKIPLELKAKSPQIDLVTGAQKAWFTLKEPIDLAPGTVGLLRLTTSKPLWVVPADALVQKGKVFSIEIRTQKGMSFIKVNPIATTHGLSVVEGLEKEFDVAVRAPVEVLHD